MTRGEQLKLARRLGAASALVALASVGTLVADHVVAVRRAPGEKSRVQALEAEVKTRAAARGFMAALAMGAEAVYLVTAFMATRECPIPERHKQSMAAADPTEPRYRERCLAPPKPEELARVMTERDSKPVDSWLRKLERVMLKDLADVPDLMGDGLTEEAVEEEILRSLPGSLAVAVIDSVVSVRELIESMISEAEEIRRRWSIC